MNKKIFKKYENKKNVTPCPTDTLIGAFGVSFRSEDEKEDNYQEQSSMWKVAQHMIQREKLKFVRMAKIYGKSYPHNESFFWYTGSCLSILDKNEDEWMIIIGKHIGENAGLRMRNFTKNSSWLEADLKVKWYQNYREVAEKASLVVEEILNES